jgi:hypothetical protein
MNKNLVFKNFTRLTKKRSGNCSIIGVGSPLIDITAQVDGEDLKKYGVEFGSTVLVNENNKGFFEHIESKSEVKYVPGGSIMNSIRVANVKFDNNKK